MADGAAGLAAEGEPPALVTPRRGFAAWLDSRTGCGALLGFLRAQGAKLVPARLPWVYTTGTLAIFFFALQAVTGSLMLLHYVPDEKLAFASVQTIEHRVPLGWLVRQLHAWGSSFIVIVLIIHVLKVLWYGAYKKPRELTWLAGFILLALTLTFCLSGYLLPWNQLAFWATRVAVGAVDAVPLVGESLKGFICGGPDVSGRTIGRFFALHVVILPAVLLAAGAIHLALVLRHGITPRTTVPEEEALGHEKALEVHGAESFFPRQVLKEVFFLNVGFALLVTVAAYLPWELGEPASLETPEGIKPEWYFLPVYQFLKYFDDDLYAAVPLLERASTFFGLTPESVGVLALTLAGLVLFLLPFIDRGRERRIRKRPFFAVIAFVFIAATGLLGVLGYVSGRTVKIAGTTYEFTTKGYPVRVEEAAAPAAPVNEPAAGEPAPAPPAGNAPAAVAPAPPAASYRADGLPPGGTCGTADCHAEEVEEWRGSAHDLAQVECRGCHGGLDTTPPDPLPQGLDAAGFAHIGIKRKRDGSPARPARPEVADLCGNCHQGVRAAFSPLHFAEPPEGQVRKTCINCHTNHTVKEPGEETYAKGYADENDPRTGPFLAARRTFDDLSREITEADGVLAGLVARGYPEAPFQEELGRARKSVDEMRPLVHSLDASLLEGRAKSIREDVGATVNDLRALESARDDRWKIVAGVWAVVIVLNALIVRMLRALSSVGPVPSRGENGNAA
jgi:quinol-cytochrome oxidoreductase complex cytochrome b subunit